MAASDVEAPYAVAPRPVPGPHFEPGPRYGYGPSLLPSTEVYSVLRDNGFSPLGIPRLRGFVYTITAIDRGGADGRLVIDARNGRILRFMPAYRMGGDNYYEEQSALHGPLGAQPPQAQPPQAQAPDQVQAAPRPSRPAHVASRTVPMPKASPLAAKPATGAGPAGGRACAEVGRGTGGRPGDNRCGSGQARAIDCADRRICRRRRGWSEYVAWRAERISGATLASAIKLRGWTLRSQGTTSQKNAPVFPGRFSLQPASYSRAPAAARIRSATLSGCETSDRWPASSSTVVAFIRLARNRSRSGLIV